MQFWVYDGSTFIEANYGTALQTNTKYFVVGTYNTSYGLKLYINGELETSTPNIFSKRTDGLNIDFGSYSRTDGFFEGSLDEGFIYNGVFTQADVTTYYNSGNGYNPYKPMLDFELTLQNEYDDSNINNFTAQITNSTIIQNITTTNGSISCKYFNF